MTKRKKHVAHTVARVHAVLIEGPEVLVINRLKKGFGGEVLGPMAYSLSGDELECVRESLPGWIKEARLVVHDGQVIKPAPGQPQRVAQAKPTYARSMKALLERAAREVVEEAVHEGALEVEE